MKPKLNLRGVDGNVFNLMAHAKIAARKSGWPKEKIDALLKEMMSSGSYNVVLTILLREFEVTL